MFSKTEQHIDVFLIYEHRDRELESLKLIQMELRNKYNINSLIFSQPFEVTNTVLAFKKYHPSVVVVPWGYSDWFIKVYSPMFVSEECPYIISLDCEQIYSNFNINRHIPSNQYCKNRIIHCVWGNNYYELLTQHGCPANNVYITGNIRVDILLKKNKSDKTKCKEMLSEEFGLDTNKKWILFAEGRLLSYSEDYIKKFEKFGISVAENRKRCEIFSRSLRNMIEAMREISPRFFDEYELIYRLHPGQDMEVELDSRIHMITKYSIYDWFPAIDYLMSHNSTSLYEAQAFGIPAIRYNDGTELQYMVVGSDKFAFVDSFNDMIDYSQDDYHASNLYEKYLGLNDGKSFKRVSELIVKVLNGETRPFDPNVNKTRFSPWTIRRIFAERLFRILVYFKGADGLKGFPSYKMRRDLPESYTVRGERL